MIREIKSAGERLWKRVEKTPTCWIWKGVKWKSGYGQIVSSGKRLRVHNVAYEHQIGPIPDGLVLDHLCRVRDCVNPYHLEPVTQRENLLRGMSFAAINARKTTCHQGHEFGRTDRRGSRICLVCRRGYINNRKGDI